MEELYPPLVIKYRKLKALGYFLVLSPCAIIFIYLLYNHIHEVIMKKELSLIKGIVIFFIVGFVIFILLDLMYALIALIDFRIQLIINEKGISHRKKFFNWQQIKKITLKITPRGKSNALYHLILTFSDGSYKIKLNFLNLDPTKIRSTAQYYLENYRKIKDFN